MNRSAFQELAKARLLDAKELSRAERFEAAYYLAGYSIECALKACVAKKTREFDFPPRDTREYYSHDLERLVKLAELAESFTSDREKDETLDRYWDIVKDWKPERRYDLPGSTSRLKAENLIEAIEDGQHRVLQCLFKYW